MKLEFGTHTLGQMRQPETGQLWWDKDDRVISQYVRIVEVTDDGRVRVRRGRDGTGRLSTVRVDRLKRRFIPIDVAPAFHRERAS